jgi:hypothetical protein
MRLARYLSSWWNFLWNEKLGFYRPPVVLPEAPPIPESFDRDYQTRVVQRDHMQRLTRLYLDYEMSALHRPKRGDRQ